MTNETPTIGLVGLGAMGSALAANLAAQGVGVVAFDVSATARSAVAESGHRVTVAADLGSLVAALDPPRDLLLCVPAARVGDVLAAVALHLSTGDTVIDAGNSWFELTDQRGREMARAGLCLVGLGVSGGPDGARNGASFMLGGERSSCDRIAGWLRPAAATTVAGPCVVNCGPGGAGHFAKMVHNAIEYGVLQVLCEVYDLHRAAGHGTFEIGEMLSRWREGALRSYLLDLTVRVLRSPDPEGTGTPMVELIEDRAGQSGTGVWALQTATRLGVPTPVLAAALTARLQSAWGGRQSVAAQDANREPAGGWSLQGIDAVARAVVICAWDEGVELLRAGSEAHGFGIEPARVVRAWRGGSILRSTLAEQVHVQLGVDGRVLGGGLWQAVTSAERHWRTIVGQAVGAGVPVPALAAALFHYDGQRRGRSPTNLLQALRDAFGAHGYRRIDQPGDFSDGWISSPGKPPESP